jgi:RTX calcium-binding nonapeptide repeat (4 copies)
VLKSLFGRLTNRPTPRYGKPAPCRLRPKVEHLEQRDVPAAGVTRLPDGVLRIQATDYGDYVTIKRDDGATDDPKDDYVVVDWRYIPSAPGSDTVRQTFTFPLYIHVNGDGGLPEALYVKSIEFRGGKGRDVCNNNSGLFSRQFGMDGNDVLNGGSGVDYLDGGRGSDWLRGYGSYDWIWGNGSSQGGTDPGAVDRLYGGDGPDDLIGGAGNVNYIYGEGGNDVVYGGDFGAVNVIVGGTGDDWLLGGSGKNGKTAFNQMFGDGGADTFIGGSNAINVMDARDGAGTDVIAAGTSNSSDIRFVDPGDFVWVYGPYPVKPPH